MNRSSQISYSITVMLLGVAVQFAAAQDRPDPGAPRGDEDKELQELSLEMLGSDEPCTGTERERDGAATLWDRLNENLRLDFDVISRVSISEKRGKPFALNAVGFDLHKVFSDSKGDIATLLLQGYLSRYDNTLHLHDHQEDDDDWEWEFHDAYLNITRWGRGQTNFKLGRFDVPFGLEPLVDTHFVVRQVMAERNLGLKKDWGISFNGVLKRFDYEISLTQGSGHEYANKGKNYALAGRIGSPSDADFVIGVSGFYGQVLDAHGIERWRAGLEPPRRTAGGAEQGGPIPGNPQARTRRAGRHEDDAASHTTRGSDGIIRRVRAGVDFQWYSGPFLLMGEAAVGRDYNQDVFNALLELDYVSPDQKWNAYVQGFYLSQRYHGGWEQDVKAVIGAEWMPKPDLFVSIQYQHDLVRFLDEPKDGMVTLQLRWRR